VELNFRQVLFNKDLTDKDNVP